MAGHGWGGKTRKMKIQGRVVALEDSKRVWRAPTQAQAQTKKHLKKAGGFFFHDIDFPSTVFSETWAGWLKKT